ncbi:class I SAM-dependent methyltransferase [Providencia stuartii]|uniref:class I SAM-dependent methyltransferase n=1 Tax=Providencia TaxID=586 RepID=UPI0027F76B1D|nr:class I SAM-dependent methyltransferase [Providencia sp. 2023EL-00965]ELR5300980.1 class I SAM-dependent methyltransferase [Providencia stuartii]MDW7587943.1 class I SAM-dependent methyltransferase [Providencia sp. 2023EL-00965]
MEIFNNLLYVKNPLGDIIMYNDKPYYRYMDKIYIPNPPSELNDIDVSSLSEIRIKLNGDVIDYDYTKSIIKYLIVKSDIKDFDSIIDFGCGGGISADVIKSMDIKLSSITGLDLCPLAIKTAINNYREKLLIGEASFFGNNSKINKDDESIDAIISSFVMHFNIYDSQINELYRVLKKEGKIVYNDYVYYKYPGHSKKIIKKLELAGFSVTKYVEEFKIPSENLIKKHLIVTAIK